MQGLAWPIAAVVLAALAAFAAVELIHLLIRRFGERSRLLTALGEHSHQAFKFAAVVLAVYLSVGQATSGFADEPWRRVLLHILLIAVVVTVAWLVATLPTAVERVALERLRADVPDNRQIRRMRTQVVLLRRVAVTVICVITLGILLMTFPNVRAIGASVLVSAGVIGAIVAIAAQSLLGNLLAGIQLVLSDAVRLDDVVVVEGEWGRVETLTLNYVAVQIWDDRRLILPTSYLTTKPFQNWTRTHAALLGTVELDVDWSVPIQAARDALRRFAEASPLWDGRVCVLQVTDATEGRLRLRALISAADAGRLWDLRCLLREQLVVWLRTYQRTALPRVRAEVADGAVLGPPPAAGPRSSEDAARAHARAAARDPDLARVFGGSLDGEERGTVFVGPEPDREEQEVPPP
ncbi:MAG TPA: mechanosensitive ion channel family protein [Vulgatibacter sp.]|nr:mechanosensitive ion channel family protein [Vulgatibacter sp.]